MKQKVVLNAEGSWLEDGRGACLFTDGFFLGLLVTRILHVGRALGAT